MQGTNNNPNIPVHIQPQPNVQDHHPTGQTEKSGKPIHTDQEPPPPYGQKESEKKTPSEIKDKGFKAFMGGFSAMIKGALNLPLRPVHGKENFDIEVYKGLGKDLVHEQKRSDVTLKEAAQLGKDFLKDNKVASGLGKALGTIPALGIGLAMGLLSAPFVGIKLGMDRYKQYKTDQKELKEPRQNAVKEFHDAELGFIDSKYAEKKINNSKDLPKTLSELKSLNERKADAFSQIPKDWRQEDRAFAEKRLQKSTNPNPQKTLEHIKQEVALHHKLEETMERGKPNILDKVLNDDKGSGKNVEKEKVVTIEENVKAPISNPEIKTTVTKEQQEQIDTAWDLLDKAGIGIKKNEDKNIQQRLETAKVPMDEAVKILNEHLDSSLNKNYNVEDEIKQVKEKYGTEKNENIQKNQPEIKTRASPEQQKEAWGLLVKNGINVAVTDPVVKQKLQERINNAQNPMVEAKQILKDLKFSVPEEKKVESPSKTVPKQEIKVDEGVKKKSTKELAKENVENNVNGIQKQFECSHLEACLILYQKLNPKDALANEIQNQAIEYKGKLEGTPSNLSEAVTNMIKEQFLKALEEKNEGVISSFKQIMNKSLSNVTDRMQLRGTTFIGQALTSILFNHFGKEIVQDLSTDKEISELRKPLLEALESKEVKKMNEKIKNFNLKNKKQIDLIREENKKITLENEKIKEYNNNLKEGEIEKKELPFKETIEKQEITFSNITKKPENFQKLDKKGNLDQIGKACKPFFEISTKIEKIIIGKVEKFLISDSENAKEILGGIKQLNNVTKTKDQGFIDFFNRCLCYNIGIKSGAAIANQTVLQAQKAIMRGEDFTKSLVNLAH